MVLSSSMFSEMITGPHGFKLTYFQTFADPTPILGEALKRRVIPIEALTT